MMSKNHTGIERKNVFSNYNFYDIKSLMKLEKLIDYNKELNREKYIELLYYSGAANIFKENYNKVNHIGKRLLDYSKLLSDEVHKGRAYNLLGISNANMSRYKEALYYYQLGIEATDCSKIQAILHLNISEVYYRLGKYKISKDYLLKSIEYSQKIDYKRLIFKANVFLSNLLNISEDANLALANQEYVNAIKSDDVSALDEFYFNIVNGRIYLKQDRLNKSRESYNAAKVILDNINMNKLKVLYYIDLTELCIKENKDRDAIENAMLACESSNVLNDDFFQYKSSLALSKAYECCGEIEEAFYYLQKSLYHSKSFSSSLFSFDKEISIMVKEKSLLNIIENNNSEIKALVNSKKKQNEIIEALETSHKLSKELFRKTDYEQVLLSSYKCINDIVKIKELNILRYDEKKNQATYEIRIIDGEKVDLDSSIIDRDQMSLLSSINDNNKNNDQMIFCIENRCYFNMSSNENSALILEIKKLGNQSVERKEEIFMKEFLTDMNVAMNRENIFTSVGKNDSSLNEYYQNLRQSLGLTTREIELIQNVYEGCTNKIIGEKLEISHNTVRNHLRNIFSKFGVASRYELINYVHERRIPLIYHQFG